MYEYERELEPDFEDCYVDDHWTDDPMFLSKAAAESPPCAACRGMGNWMELDLKAGGIEDIICKVCNGTGQGPIAKGA